jgi:hypothetical protein
MAHREHTILFGCPFCLLRIDSSGPPSSSNQLRASSHFKGLPEPRRSLYSAEEYEFSPSLAEWSRSAYQRLLRPRYRDGDTIDWWHEGVSERERRKRLASQHGFRGLISPFMDVAKLWFVIILTGICVGLAGGWLDILVMW